MLRAGELSLDRVAEPERRCNELAHAGLAGVDAVQPWLKRADDIVLRGGCQAVLGGFSGEHVDRTGGYLHRTGMPLLPIKSEPERLVLVHRNDGVTGAQAGEGACFVILRNRDRWEPPESGRERVGVPVVGNAQRPL